eukprot:SAG31_NODE_45708_length_257_cov_1.955696_1_plen_52_part_10
MENEKCDTPSCAGSFSTFKTFVYTCLDAIHAVLGALVGYHVIWRIYPIRVFS